MESNMTKMNQILNDLKEKYKLMDQLMTFTKEMEKVVNADDFESLGTVLSMRQDMMDRIDRLNIETAKKVSSLDQPYRDKIKVILAQTGEPLRLENPLETNIFDTNKRTMLLLQKIIVLDDAVNKRMQNK